MRTIPEVLVSEMRREMDALKLSRPIQVEYFKYIAGWAHGLSLKARYGGIDRRFKCCNLSRSDSPTHRRGFQST